MLSFLELDEEVPIYFSELCSLHKRPSRNSKWWHAATVGFLFSCWAFGVFEVQAFSRSMVCNSRRGVRVNHIIAFWLSVLVSDFASFPWLISIEISQVLHMLTLLWFYQSFSSPFNILFKFFLIYMHGTILNMSTTPRKISTPVTMSSPHHKLFHLQSWSFITIKLSYCRFEFTYHIYSYCF